MKNLQWRFLLASLLLVVSTKSVLGEEQIPVKKASLPCAINSEKFSLLGKNLEKIFKSGKREVLELLSLNEDLLKNDVLILRFSDYESPEKDVTEFLDLEIVFGDDQVSSIAISRSYLRTHKVIAQ